jgi:bacterioferritin-associated ferredoxin
MTTMLVNLSARSSAVIVCSCNVLSDGQIRSAIASAAPRPRLSHIYASLDCAAKCGRCACTIKVMLEELRRFVTSDSIAIEAANISLNSQSEKQLSKLFVS